MRTTESLVRRIESGASEKKFLKKAMHMMFLTNEERHRKSQLADLDAAIDLVSDDYEKKQIQKMRGKQQVNKETALGGKVSDQTGYSYEATQNPTGFNGNNTTTSLSTLNSTTTSGFSMDTSGSDMDDGNAGKEMRILQVPPIYKPDAHDQHGRDLIENAYAAKEERNLQKLRRKFDDDERTTK